MGMVVSSSALAGMVSYQAVMALTARVSSSSTSTVAESDAD